MPTIAARFAPLLLPIVGALLAPTAAGHIELVGQLADGSVLFVHPKGRLARLDPATGELRGAPGDGVTTWNEAALDSARERIAGIDGNGRLQVWEFATGECVASDVVQNPLGLGVQWTADAGHIVTWSRVFWGSNTLGSAGSPAPVRIFDDDGALLWEGPPAWDVDVHPAANALCILVSHAAHEDQGATRGDEDTKGEAGARADTQPLELMLGWPEEAGGKGFERVALDGFAHSVAYSPDGERIAATGSRAGTWDSGEPRFLPHLWILDAEKHALAVDRKITGVDPMELKSRGEFVRWSPDGRWLGVTLGKGHAPGILDASDGSTRRSGDFRGGRMNEIFPVAWMANGKLLSYWPTALLLDPDPEVPDLEPPFMTRSDALVLDGTDDLVCVRLHLDRPETVVRVDGATGAVLWTWDERAQRGR